MHIAPVRLTHHVERISLSMLDVARELGRQWNLLNEEGKAPFVAAAAKEKADGTTSMPCSPRGTLVPNWNGTVRALA
jgi:hypothetical protein